MKNSKNIWGIFFVLAAVYVIIGRLGILPYIGIFRIGVTVLLVWMLAEGIRRMNFYEILFSIAFLCIVYDRVLEITSLTPWTVLCAALFGSIGLTLIFNDRHQGWEGGAYAGSDGMPEGGAYTGREIRIENNFSTAIRYINSDDFQMARIENHFGTLSVYLDNAVVPSGTAYLRIENSFGVISLYIPKEWQVETDISRAFGTVSVAGINTRTDMTVVSIHGDSSFGTVRIYYI